jgi:hypothetical protein
MKIKTNYTLVEISGEYVAVATDGQENNTRHIIHLNETGKLIWDSVEKGMDVPAIVARLLDEYEVDEQTATRSVERIVRQMLDAGIAEA